jgi:hypothetical protein
MYIFYIICIEHKRHMIAGVHAEAGGRQQCSFSILYIIIIIYFIIITSGTQIIRSTARNIYIYIVCFRYVLKQHHHNL